jgi:hypothetical protein
MEERKKYWFPARSPEYGWGWGMPTSWQGWAVYLVLLVLLVGGLILLASQRHQVLAMLWGPFIGALLIGACYWKGEPPGPFLGRGKGNPGQTPKRD